MIASSDMNEKEMRNELEVGLSHIKGVKVENKTESKKTHSKITCSLVMIGGSSRGSDGLFQNKYDSLSSCMEEIDSFINQDQTKLTDLIPVSYSLKYAADNAPLYCRVTITDTGGEWLRDWIGLKNTSVSIDYNSAKKNAVTTMDLYKLDEIYEDIYIKNPFAVCDVRRSDVIPEID